MNNEELNKAAEKYEEWAESYDTRDYPTYLSARDAFKAGAQWMKEQMMKEAVEGEIIIAGNDGYSPHADVKLPNTPYFHLGQKIKLIIIKED